MGVLIETFKMYQYLAAVLINRNLLLILWYVYHAYHITMSQTKTI